MRPAARELGADVVVNSCEGGQLVVVGIAAGAATSAIPITPMVRRGMTITGSFGARTRRDLLDAGQIQGRAIVVLDPEGQ